MSVLPRCRYHPETIRTVDKGGSVAGVTIPGEIKIYYAFLDVDRQWLQAIAEVTHGVAEPPDRRPVAGHPAGHLAEDVHACQALYSRIDPGGWAEVVQHINWVSETVTDA